METTNVFTRISSDPANGVVYSYVTGGTVLVQRKGDTYTIDMDIVMEDGEPFRGHFKGDIIFENMSRKHHRALTSLLRKIKRCLSL